MALDHCSRWALADIGLNLTDKMFFGVYQGSRKHKSDVEAVLSRATKVGVRGILLTAGSVRESRESIELCSKYNTPALRCLCTVGCHPTRCTEFEKDPEDYFSKLDMLIAQNTSRNGGCVAALGEMGLDYDRLFFCEKETQRTYFTKQLELADRHHLPLFLHDRNTGDDVYDIISRHRSRFPGGVVHSFTGTTEDLRRYLDLDLFIGINGCSLKTESNLEVARLVPLDKLMIETDGPWCDVRNTHASRALLSEAGKRHESGKCISDSILGQFPTCRKEKFADGAVVKGRCEPCHLVQVLEVLFELNRHRVDSLGELARTLWDNTNKLFPFTAAQ